MKQTIDAGGLQGEQEDWSQRGICLYGVYVRGSNVDDARELREEHRILGTLTGCLPRAPRQNTHLGLPLQLMPEEVTLLVEKGLAVVVEQVYREPTDADISEQTEARSHSYQQQVELYQDVRREEVKRHLPQILDGKKKRRKKMMEEAGRGTEIDEEELEKQITLESETVDVPEIKESMTLIQLPIEALARESTTCRVVDWSYPDTPSERLRYQVFKDFWERGHCLTSGSKFGGDFLVYPGDPSRYHSFYIAVCLEHDGEISTLDVITMGRLATIVKKTMVVCSHDNEGNICHTSLQWTGIS